MLRALLIALLLVPTVFADEPAEPEKPKALKYSDYFDAAKGLHRTFTTPNGEVEVIIVKRLVTKKGVTLTVQVKQGEKSGFMVEKVEADGFYRGSIHKGKLYGSYFFKGPLILGAVHKPTKDTKMKLVSLDTKFKVGEKELSCIVFQFSKRGAKFYYSKGVGMVRVTTEVKQGEKVALVELLRLKSFKHQSK